MLVLQNKLCFLHTTADFTSIAYGQRVDYVSTIKGDSIFYTFSFDDHVQEYENATAIKAALDRLSPAFCVDRDLAGNQPILSTANGNGSPLPLVYYTVKCVASAIIEVKANKFLPCLIVYFEGIPQTRNIQIFRSDLFFSTRYYWLKQESDTIDTGSENQFKSIN